MYIVEIETKKLGWMAFGHRESRKAADTLGELLTHMGSTWRIQGEEAPPENRVEASRLEAAERGVGNLAKMYQEDWSTGIEEMMNHVGTLCEEQRLDELNFLFAALNTLPINQPDIPYKLLLDLGITALTASNGLPREGVEFRDVFYHMLSRLISKTEGRFMVRAHIGGLNDLTLWGQYEPPTGI